MPASHFGPKCANAAKAPELGEGAEAVAGPGCAASPILTPLHGSTAARRVGERLDWPGARLKRRAQACLRRSAPLQKVHCNTACRCGSGVRAKPSQPVSQPLASAARAAAAQRKRRPSKLPNKSHPQPRASGPGLCGSSFPCTLAAK